MEKRQSRRALLNQMLAKAKAKAETDRLEVNIIGDPTSKN